MGELRFEWDPVKAAVNLRKHGIDFVEAKSVFADERQGSSPTRIIRKVKIGSSCSVSASS